MTTTQLILAALRSRTVWYAIALAILSILQGFVLQLPIRPGATPSLAVSSRWASWS